MLRLSIFKPLIVFSVVANALMLVAPIHMMQVYDRVLSSSSKETLFYITLIAAFLLAVFGASEAIRSKIAQRISAKFALMSSDPMFLALVSKSPSSNQSQKVLRDFNTIRTFLSSRAMIGLFDLPFAPLFLLILFVLHYQVGLLTTLGIALLAAIAWVNKASTSQDQSQAAEANSNAIAFAGTVFSRSEDIRAMGLLPSLTERWGKMMATNLNAQDRSAAKTAFFFGISRSIRQILQIMIMAWGAYLVLSGDMSGGMIFAASMISGRAIQPIEQVIGGWDNINRARAAYKDFNEFLKQSEATEEKIKQPAPKGELNANEISISIEGSSGSIPILNNISLEVPAGQILAIIGPSGAGKSSLARVLSGANQPTNGEVLLDGCAQSNWQAGQWGEYVGYLAQDIMLFPGTIAENIARMAVDPNEEQVVNAARAANVHELINKLPDGYMTVIGDSNVRLSGGQKQRIALARALYSRPRVLVLDEPNAHLDTEGEERLMQTLALLKRNKVTVVMVTQRKQILRVADRVVTIENGTITADKMAPTAKRPSRELNKNIEALKNVSMQATIQMASPTPTAPENPVTKVGT